ncbi:MAG: SDR family oxidoreductase [Limisphaerales bacterium]
MEKPSPVQGDVSKKSDIEKLFVETKKAFGKVDVLVNNAGIYEFSALEQVTEEHFHKQFNLNVLGLILTTQEAVKLFPATGGSIINISSGAAGGVPGASVYSATKGAVDTISKSLAKELGPKKIRVNSLSPGMVETEGVHAAGFLESDFHKQIVAQTPLGRIGQPDDIGRIAVFLASEDSGWITGEAILASGGHRLG